MGSIVTLENGSTNGWHKYSYDNAYWRRRIDYFAFHNWGTTEIKSLSFGVDSNEAYSSVEEAYKKNGMTIGNIIKKIQWHFLNRICKYQERV